MSKDVKDSPEYKELTAKLDGIAKGKETQEIIEKIATGLSELVVSVAGRAYKQGHMDGARRVVKDFLGVEIPENLQ